jgi:hypothetical protein
LGIDMNSGSTSFVTVGEIARRIDVPLHRVEYLIRARRIAAIGRAGNARVFSESVVQRIAEEVAAVRGASSTSMERSRPVDAAATP